MKKFKELSNINEGRATESHDYHKSELKRTSDKIDNIVKSGGRVGLDDPLSVKLKKHSDAIKKMKMVKEEQLEEGRPSQRHPLEGHEYHKKTNAELEYIAKDAHKAAEAMKGHNTTAENKYRDQANDSATVRYFRQKSGTPDWYKKKYGHMKEETDTTEKTEMAQTQLHFMKYAAEEILEFIEMGGEVEEWYQNKLSKVMSDIESLHSYVEGESRRTGMKEEVSKTVPTMSNAPKMVRDRKTGQMYDPNKKFKELMNKPEIKAVMNRLAKEEVELDEAKEKVKRTEEDYSHKGKKIGTITTTTTKSGMTFYTANHRNSFVAGLDTKEEAIKHLKKLHQSNTGMKEEVELEESKTEDKVAKHNAAVAKMAKHGFIKTLKHPDVLKTAPKGHQFTISHRLVKMSEEVEMDEAVTYGAVTPTMKAKSKQVFNAGVKHGKEGAEKDKKHMDSLLFRKTYLNGYKQGIKEEIELDEADKKETPPFDKPYKTVKNGGTVTDKSGAKHTPMSRVRDLARKAAQQQSKLKESDLTEAEQLDELSKKTLGSYAKKATSSMRGVAASAEVVGALDRDNPLRKTYQDRTLKRVAGVEKAVDRLTKEEVEQLDEISNKTLQSYRSKAHTQIQHYKYAGGKDKPEASSVLAKREPGMTSATAKVIQKDKERIAAQPKREPQKASSYKPLGGRDEKSGRSYSEEVELQESRRANIVREAMEAAKKKKKQQQEQSSDKFNADPTLSSEIVKT
jgi:hypothetical protein